MALFNGVFTPTDSDTQTKTNTEFLRFTTCQWDGTKLVLNGYRTKSPQRRTQRPVADLHSKVWTRPPLDPVFFFIFMQENLAKY